MSKTPERETAVEIYRCRCVLGSIDGDGRCHNQVNADQPFCSDCESRHPFSDPVHVNAVPLDIR